VNKWAAVSLARDKRQIKGEKGKEGPGEGGARGSLKEYQSSSLIYTMIKLISVNDEYKYEYCATPSLCRMAQLSEVIDN